MNSRAWTAENSRTAQRQARLERRAHAFDISGDAALLIDRETLCVVDANEAACRLFGCTLDELLMLQPNEIIGSGNTAAELAAILDDVIAHVPQTTTTETISRKKDGAVLRERSALGGDVLWRPMDRGGDDPGRHGAQEVAGAAGAVSRGPGSEP